MFCYDGDFKVSFIFAIGLHYLKPNINRVNDNKAKYVLTPTKIKVKVLTNTFCHFLTTNI